MKIVWKARTVMVYSQYANSLGGAVGGRDLTPDIGTTMNTSRA